jgi:hypothetical protein
MNRNPSSLLSSTSGPNTNQQGGDVWSQKYLRDKIVGQRAGFLAPWYRLTAPPEPPPSANFAVREATRRGLLSSMLVFYWLLIIILVAIPVGFLSRNYFIVIGASTAAVASAISLYFNRRGHPNVTGLLLSLSIEFGLIGVIRFTPGGLDPSSLGLFDLLVFVEIFVASLLPINWVILAAAFNIAFIVFDLATQGPHGDALMITLMHQNAPGVILRPVVLHVVVTVVLWLWVRSATRAIERADRAEVIATLEHSIAEQEHQVAEQKRVLDASIQQILQTHIRVSNGDFNARVVLGEGDPLWSVAGSLNNLLSRLQRLRQSEQNINQLAPRLQRANQMEHEYQRVSSEIDYIIQAVKSAENRQKLIQMRQNGTILDPLTTELNNKYLFSPERQAPSN